MYRRSVGIIGIGSYAPEKVLTNKDLENMVDTSDEWIVERTGIKQRHIAAEDQATSDLAVVAAKRALENANVKPEELDLVVVATTGPDMVFPSTACIVQDKIGAINAGAFDLQAGCSGFVYAISVVSNMIATGVYNKILVVGAEKLSAILDWTDRNTCVLFGDGAGAAVLSTVPEGYGILGMHLGADGSGMPHLNMPAGGTRLPASEETIAQRQHFIKMNGNEVFKFAIKVMGEVSQKALSNAGIKTEMVDWCVPHQANIRIIQSAAKRLKMPLDKFIVNVDKYGNTSAASVPIALDEAVKSGKIKQDDMLVLVGFGAGLTSAACVMKWYKGGQ